MMPLTARPLPGSVPCGWSLSQRGKGASCRQGLPLVACEAFRASIPRRDGNNRIVLRQKNQGELRRRRRCDLWSASAVPDRSVSEVLPCSSSNSSGSDENGNEEGMRSPVDGNVPRPLGSDSSEDRPEGSGFMQGQEMRSCTTDEHEGEEHVMRSTWDLKIPEIDEPKQMKKMMQVLGLTSCAAMLSNMDKVNMSVAMVPMMTTMGWSTTVVGILQACFFWGYFVAQIPSGKLVSSLGGRVILSVGVFGWSCATLLAPTCAHVSIALLCATRFFVGFFEATAPSANADLITRWAAVEERSRSVTAVWAGFNIGNVIGLLLAPSCFAAFGWEAIFYIFGGLGLLWSAAWIAVNYNLPLPSKKATSRLEFVRVGEVSKLTENSFEEGPDESSDDPIPYGNFFRIPAFWAMNITHFCENWGKFTLMAFMPMFYRSTLGLELQTCAVLAILPYILGIMMSTVAATIADSLITRGWSLTLVRKLMQCTGSASACAFMLIGIFVTAAPLKVACLTGALAASNLSTVGLYCSHQDISPKYAAVMLSITNTFGSLPGIFGNLMVGALMDFTGSWTISLIIPCAICYGVSAVAWGLLYSSDPVDFDNMDEESGLDDHNSQNKLAIA